MRKSLLFLAAISLPQLGFGQTGPASSRFYVGVGANLLTDVPGNSAGVPTLVGPALTGGMQLTPRLALQVGVAYHWQHDSYSYDSYTFGSGGTTVSSNVKTDIRHKYFLVPVLLRYTFTDPAERFHFDGLAGLTLMHGSVKYTTSGAPGGYGGYYPDNFSSASTEASFTLGPAVRYSLTPTVELTANALVSTVLGNTYYSFSDRLFLNVLVGAHYTFGSF